MRSRAFLFALFLSAIAGALVGAIVGVVSHIDHGDPPAPVEPTDDLRYLDCGPGGAHIWLTGDGSIAVIPAGGDCAGGTP